MTNKEARQAAQELKNILSAPWLKAGLRSPWRTRVAGAPGTLFWFAEVTNGPLLVRPVTWHTSTPLYEATVRIRGMEEVKSRPRSDPRKAAAEAHERAMIRADQVAVQVDRIKYPPDPRRQPFPTDP